jgi:hypothetical protein
MTGPAIPQKKKPNVDPVNEKIKADMGIQADATRAPSGLTQKLGEDVARKKSVLAQEGYRPDLPIQDEDGKVQQARREAEYGGRRTGKREPLGTYFSTRQETPQDQQRDDNVVGVGRSLDATASALDASRKADDTKRNSALRARLASLKSGE